MSLQNHTRNFAIIAHIDHGKSTLADRMMEFTGLLDARTKSEQYLDKMDIEKERGITIKAQSVRMIYKAKNGEEYVMNLIDTPGHVDFSYEVSRSLSAAEGALLLVDASQGVEAQTMANAYLAANNNLEIITVINKMDLPNANPEMVKTEIEEMLGLNSHDAIPVSAKTGQGIQDIFETIVTKVPSPKGHATKPLRALIFDSWFDPYKGTIIMVRVVDGTIKVSQDILMMAGTKKYTVSHLGYFAPEMTFTDELKTGDVGFMIAGIKNVKETKIGDTITDFHVRAEKRLHGFKEIKPVVFSSLFPVDADDYANLKEALERLTLNDSSISYEAENSPALGFGFRCGFLGLLHMEIVCERLTREFNLSLINTAPSVIYHVTEKNGTVTDVANPSKLPDPGRIAKIEEPMVLMTIHTPSEYVGNILKLCEDKRGRQKELKFLSNNRVVIEYFMPLGEIILDFHDRLKSLTKGYGTFDYEITNYEESDLVKLDILVNGEIVDALSIIIHQSKSYYMGRELTTKIKDALHQHLFTIAIQAAIGGRIIARETKSALRKNVTAKCYGGDITRKRKLLEKQKEGKKRMRKVGKVEIPQEAFLAILKVD